MSTRMILRWSVVWGLLTLTLSTPAPIPASTLLTREHQLTLLLDKDQYRRAVLVSERAGFPLSVALTPCSSPVHWTVHFSLGNSTLADLKDATLLKEFQSRELETYKIVSSKIGRYIIQMSAQEGPTRVQVFASAEPEPPHAARMAQRPRLRLQPRQRRHRLTAKWDQSPIDPHVTEYCLVVSSRRNFTSLCGAQGEQGAQGAQGAQGGQAGAEATAGTGGGRRGRGHKRTKITLGSAGGQDGLDDIHISCVGDRTHHTVNNLQHGKMYYFNLFAVNKQTNLTFLYGSTKLQYDQRVQQSRLKDGKPESINLKKLDGKAVFRFKAGRHATDRMLVSIMPCGGAVDVEVLLRGKVVQKKRRIDSYERLIIPSVRRGQRYIITVLATNREELRRTSAVEVLATTKQQIPLPELPSQTEVRDFSTLRACNAVTVGWMPSPDPTAFRYCVVARESKRRDSEPRAPDQCALETRLRKSADYHLMHCRDWTQPIDMKKVMMEKISGLKPGRRYVVQVTVKKSGGKTLSYDLHTVHTKATCT